MNGIYQVSNLGRVKSLKFNKEKIIKISLHKRGYLNIILWKDGIIKNFKPHRLVAEAFIPNPNNLSQVNHINGDKTDNRADNLEWCSGSENQLHSFRTGLHKSIKGLQHRKSFKVIQFDLQGKYIKTWENMREIERHLKINDTSIYRCCRGKQKTAGGYIWKYEL